MSNSHGGEYLFYTEYYIISGVYHVMNVVNEILTYSASCSDNIKGYLHNKVLNKKASLNELVRNNQGSHNGISGINNSNSNKNDDVDEDGFVVIKMRRPKKNKNESHNVNIDNTNNMVHRDNINMNNRDVDQNKNLNCNIHNDSENDIIIQKIVEEMIKNVIKRLDKNVQV